MKRAREAVLTLFLMKEVAVVLTRATVKLMTLCPVTPMYVGELSEHLIMQPQQQAPPSSRHSNSNVKIDFSRHK